MYLPEQFAETDSAALHALIDSRPLGSWVTQLGGELVGNHIPFLLDPQRGERGVLCAHVARANPVWKTLSPAQSSLVMFHGPQAYVSPSWYPGKQLHGRAVPTWNYVVVHVRGIARAIDDPAWLRTHLERLTRRQEGGQAEPWQVSDAPDDYLQQMMSGIVGIEIPIDHIQGKWKASQNRAEADRLGVIAGLERQTEPDARAMAAFMTAPIIN